MQDWEDWVDKRLNHPDEWNRDVWCRRLGCGLVLLGAVLTIIMISSAFYVAFASHN